MKAILMSIKPKWCELIFSGKKTIEVRKTAPQMATPFKVYVYETKTGFIEAVRGTCPICAFSRGKVVGEFVCEGVRAYIPFGLRGFELPPKWLEQMCLSKEQLDKYGGLKTLYGWHITEPKLYDKPKELSEFRTPETRFHEVKQVNGHLIFGDGYRGGKVLTHPPQSWCYVEEIEE